MKRLTSILSLVLAVAMLLCMFAVSANAEAKKLEIVWNDYNPFPFEEGKNTAAFKVLTDMFAARGLELDITAVNPDQYATVLQGKLTSGDIPDYFNATYLSPADRINLIEQGKIMAFDDVLQYSNGVAVDAFTPGGDPTNEVYCNMPGIYTHTDGKQYFIGSGGCGIPVVDDRAMGTTWSTDAFWTMKIRTDWLEKCGLEMPTTLDEYFNALVTFREKDANGNGIADERMVLNFPNEQTLTANNNYGASYFNTGIAQWFGLVPYMYNLDRSTYTAQVPFLQEGFKPYMEFLRKCVEAEVLYLSDKGTQGGTELTALVNQDVVASYMWKATEELVTSPDQVYESLPVIQAVEGIEPVIACTLTSKWYDYYAFSSEADPEAVAMFLDVILHYDYSMWYRFGNEEGVTYKRTESGWPIMLAPSAKDDIIANGGHGAGLYVRIPGMPTTTLWGYQVKYYDEKLEWKTFDEFINSTFWQDDVNGFSASYDEIHETSHERIASFADKYMLVNYNLDINQVCGMPNAEEAEILSFYSSELDTYVNEVMGSILNGSIPLDGIDDAIEEIRGIGLDEVYGVYNSLLRRAKGLE